MSTIIPAVVSSHTKEASEGPTQLLMGSAVLWWAAPDRGPQNTTPVSSVLTVLKQKWCSILEYTDLAGWVPSSIGSQAPESFPPTIPGSLQGFWQEFSRRFAHPHHCCCPTERSVALSGALTLTALRLLCEGLHSFLSLWRKKRRRYYPSVNFVGVT